MNQKSKFKLEQIDLAEAKKFIGKVVFKASRGPGPHWILKAINGKKATLETPVTWKRSTAPITDLRYDANENIKY